MADLLGKDYAPPDIYGKVTGRAKYAEDFRRDGMLFCRLLKSPMPHCRVRGVDATAALAMDGVVGILTAADVPSVDAPGEPCLTNEPLYEGEPILAVAATGPGTNTRNGKSAMKALTKTTRSIKPAEVEKKWHIIDAEGLVVGRLAVRRRRSSRRGRRS